MTSGRRTMDVPKPASFAWRDAEQSRLAALEHLRTVVKSVPLPSPQELYDSLSGLGYVGQPKARRSLALMAHRHVRRLRHLYVEGIPREELPPKDNYLLIGPTGCGKTYLIELLFKQLLGLPTCVIDVTTLSETGYVGQDVSSTMTRLLYAADMDWTLAQIGIVCLDEFDKIASGQNKALFAGQGTTKDVTGMGVQRELLKQLEASTVPVLPRLDHSTIGETLLLHTQDIAFVAAGAFSGLKTICERHRNDAGLGFGKTAPKPSQIAARFDDGEFDDVSVFQEYGFLPELIGRFSRIVAFEPLGHEELIVILEEKVLAERRLEFQLAGYDLVVEKEVLLELAERAARRETGARGVAAELTALIEDAAFEAYSATKPATIAIQKKNGQITFDIG